MSFFKDFKEDLSQAVNELMPDESGRAAEPAAAEPATDPADDIARLLQETDAPAMAPAPAPAEPAPAPVPENTIEQAPQPESNPVSIDILPDDNTQVIGMDQPGMQVEPVYAPAPEPVPVQQTAPPMESVPVQAAPPVYERTPAPAPAPAPVQYAETAVPRRPVEPVFRENSYRAAPINTTGVRTGKETGVIIKEMSVTGDIISEGNLEIQGSVKGNIKLAGKLKVGGSIEGNSDVEEVFADSAKITGDLRATGAVKIGQGTVVKGNINATSGVIAGAIKGDIDIVGPVILDSTAIIMGNIKSRTLQINNGAVIEGLCSQCYAEVNPSSFFDKE
ncbi:MAG: polymer-forming cytoskeletal protein [Lachnospiraceae bacterium]|nr:polymer-forming cytoskeletal protein [Lachnospiraceae bacterium]